MQTPFWQCSASELVRHYQTRDISPVQVLQATLERIDALNPSINAMSFVDTKAAQSAAQASEKRWRNGAPAGPLDGVPVSVKDHMAAIGMPSYCGSLALDKLPPDSTDAPVTARLRESGAIILGKTTMPDFGLIASGISSRYGVTHNPWDLSRNSGGSSSGAAAALASGFGPLAIGSDGGGSIRIPAAYCGVFGLKPSYGRVPLQEPAPWVVAGPMARSVQDAALLLNVISRPDWRDFSALAFDARDYTQGLDTGVRGARIGVLEDIGFGQGLDPQVRDKLHQAARVFEQLGAFIEPVGPLFGENPEPDFDRILHLRTYLQFSTMATAQQDLMLPQLAHWCRQEIDGSKQALMQSLVRTGAIRRATLAPFETHDFLLAPVMAMLPFAVESAWAEGGTAHNPFCFPFNMSEQPAASIHGGFSREAWPVGLQIIGRRFDDHGVLRAAFAYDSATGYLQARPPIGNSGGS